MPQKTANGVTKNSPQNWTLKAENLEEKKFLLKNRRFKMTSAMVLSTDRHSVAMACAS